MREWKNKAQEKTADRNTEKQAKYKPRLEERCRNCRRHIQGWWEKEQTQIWCAVAPTGWMGCWRRGKIKQNSTFDSKTVLKIHAFSFCSHTYHTYSHLLDYTAWRTSFCFPAHFKGLYFTSMHLEFLGFWFQSGLMKSGRRTTLTCRAGEENHCLWWRPGTVVFAMVLPSQPTDPKILLDTATLWLPCSVSLFPKMFQLWKILCSQNLGKFWLLTAALVVMHARSLNMVIPEN